MTSVRIADGRRTVTVRVAPESVRRPGVREIRLAAQGPYGGRLVSAYLTVAEAEEMAAALVSAIAAATNAHRASVTLAVDPRDAATGLEAADWFVGATGMAPGAAVVVVRSPDGSTTTHAPA